MTREELIGSLRSCAELVKKKGLDACAAVMRAAADRMEDVDKFYTVRYEHDGLTLKYNEETGEWDRYECYMSVDCLTEEDYKCLVECVEKQKEKDFATNENGAFLCPGCGVEFCVNSRFELPKYCKDCGQKVVLRPFLSHEDIFDTAYCGKENDDGKAI